MKTYVDFTFANRQLWNLLFERRCVADGPMPPTITDSLDRIVVIVREALKPAVKPPNGGSADHDARVLWAGVHGITALSNNQRDRRHDPRSERPA